MLDRELIVRWMKQSAALIEENREYLTRLDAAVGDADHGINMSRGFKKVDTLLSGSAPPNAAGLLKAVAMALMSSVGGASGPLYGTLFLKASTAAASAGEGSRPAETAAALLRAGLDGVKQRGMAGPGDKTMIDALEPAVETLELAASQGRTLEQALADAAAAAEQGMRETIPMTARKGRASYLGERSAGHQDPGATSAWLLLKALARAAGGEI
jgi:dihydroxyacetone kinase-like protein